MKKIIALFLAVVVTISVGISVFFIVNNCSNKEEPREKVVITSQINFIDIDNKFNLTNTTGATSLSYSLNAQNELSYLYAHISSSLPSICYRYNELYIIFNADNVNEVVIQVNNSVFKATNIKKGDNIVSLFVDDWGLNPRVLIYPDTYSSTLNTAYSNNKTISFTEIGFYEP